jgi:hypothetical protein
MRIFYWLLLIGVWIFRPAYGIDKKVELVTRGNISELVLRLEIADELSDDVVTVSGQYSRPKWQLLFKDEKLNKSEDGKLRFKVKLGNKSVVYLNLKAVGPTGEAEQGVYEIHVSPGDKSPARFGPISLKPELGFTSISYRETDQPDYSAFVLTAKVGASRKMLVSELDLGANVFFTLLPISKSSDATARFLGANIRLGYLPRSIAPPWKLAICTGLYYTRMFVTSNRFGFAGMVGPQLFVTGQYTLKNNDAIQGYGKLSPVTSSETDSMWTFKNRELALGGSFIHPLQNGHNLSVGADFSSFNIVFPDMTIQVRSLSLGVGYSL